MVGGTYSCLPTPRLKDKESSLLCAIVSFDLITSRNYGVCRVTKIITWVRILRDVTFDVRGRLILIWQVYLPIMK